MSQDPKLPGPTPRSFARLPGYTWRQTQETVHIWIELLPTTQVTDIQVDMTSKELLVKVDGIGLCLAGRLHQAIDVPSSTWVLEKLQGREGFELQLEKQVPLEWRYPIKGDCENRSEPMDAQSALEIAKHFERIRDFPNALKYLDIAVERGHSIAKVQRGKICQLGPESMYAVERDLAKAFTYYLDSATTHFSGEAMFLVGIAYQEGNGVNRSAKTASEWFQRCVTPDQIQIDVAHSGETGTPKHTITALFNLGILYQSEGTDLKIDFKKAIGWWEQAAEHQFPPAFFNLGIMYLHGKGVPKDIDRARGYFQEANRLNPNLRTPMLAAMPPGVSATPAAPQTPQGPGTRYDPVTPRYNLGDQPTTQEGSWAWWTIATAIVATACFATLRK